MPGTQFSRGTRKDHIPLLPSGPDGVLWSFVARDWVPGKKSPKLAEKEGFEPTGRCRPDALQAPAFDHSATSPQK
jgi:hypothetical protein